MTVKKRLLEISELNIATELTQMSDDEFNRYVQVLNSFVERFPAQEANVKKALGERDYLSLTKTLVAVKDMLVQIHADALAKDCLKQINGLTDVRHEKFEAYMTYFLSVLTMLSIDIQMATLKGKNGPENRQPVKNNEPGGNFGSVGPVYRFAPKTRKGNNILAVDDSAFALGALRNILRDTEYKLTCVTSGRDALKFMWSHRPDLFILDIEMPLMDGYELAERIRGKGHTAPIVFLTANATKEYVMRAFSAGGVDFIVKPPHREFVLTKIAKYI